MQKDEEGWRRLALGADEKQQLPNTWQQLMAKIYQYIAIEIQLWNSATVKAFKGLSFQLQQTLIKNFDTSMLDAKSE